MATPLDAWFRARVTGGAYAGLEGTVSAAEVSRIREKPVEVDEHPATFGMRLLKSKVMAKKESLQLVDAVATKIVSIRVKNLYIYGAYPWIPLSIQDKTG